MKIISEGAEAKIYSTNILGIPAIVKDRVRKSYREKQLDARIRKQRTRTEAKILAIASEKGIRVPKVIMLGSNQITMEGLKGTMLNALPEKAKTTAIISECARQLSALHALGIVHGDYTPANILVDGSWRAWVIDFGLGEITNSVEEKALDVLLMKRAIRRNLYAAFEKEYLRASKGSGRAIIAQLSEIEKRGRYQTRTLLSKA
jgi:TP53 regulating kinase and related kinases